MKGGGILATQKGPETIFSKEQENNICLWIKTMANAGFPISKEILIHSVAKLAKECQISFPGGNELPGRRWFESFMRRNSNIKMRTSQNLTTCRQQVSQVRINDWFDEVARYIEDNNLKDVLLNPRRVFNCDETAFFLNPKPKKVLAQKGSKNVYTTAGADEKFNLTCLLTGNASGELAPPMVIYRYARIPQRVAEAMPANWAIGKSENGWMTQETFYEYITNIFEPYLRTQGIKTPVILFMDGHSSHLSLHLSTFCKNNGIELVALLPNATHLLQPMDVEAVFHALKTIWREEVMNFRICNGGNQLQNQDFPRVLKSALERLSPDTISNGFRACGLIPWDPKKITVTNSETSYQKSALPSKSKDDNFLTILENKIGESKLKLFKENVGDWNGPVEQTDLYYLWLQAKSSSNLQPLSPLYLETTREEIDLDDHDLEDNFMEEELSNHTELINASSIGDQNVVEKADTREIVEHCNGSDTTNCPIAGPSKIPSPFKRALFWPQREESKRKKRKQEKLPAVVTSPQMILYYKKKEDAKNTKMAEKEKRKIERERRKMEKEKKILNNIKRSRKSSEFSISIDDSVENEDNYSELDESEEEGLPIQDRSEIKEGQFVLVSMMGGKRNSQKYVYLCIIQGVSDEQIEVQGLKSIKNKKNFTIVENDFFNVTYKDLVSIMPEPDLKMKDRQLIYIFDKKLAVKEKM